MSEKVYQECVRCVMDTTDPEITFNADGVCNHCLTFDTVTSKRWWPNQEGAKKLTALFEKIQEEESSKPYDCILGLSGGVDSSYLALKLHDAKLRPLVIHVDGGWNSELAVSNIEKIVKYCGWHLHTIVIPWDEMQDLQLAYLKSGVPNQDVPQDHAFFASLYHFAIKHGIRYIMNGGNIATEAVFPKAWEWSAMDATNLKAIHRKYGTKKLRHYKTIGFFKYYFYYPFIKKMRVVRPLNYMPYDKEQAIEELKTRIGYKAYDRKHGESVFTKFFQNYYQPMKFGFDKRRPHLSSLIVSGQLTRSEALQALEKPLYDERELRDDKEYVAKKLGLSSDAFDTILNAPIHSHQEFKNMGNKYTMMKKLQALLAQLTGKSLANYS